MVGEDWVAAIGRKLKILVARVSLRLRILT